MGVLKRQMEQERSKKWIMQHGAIDVAWLIKKRRRRKISVETQSALKQLDASKGSLVGR